MTTLLLQKFGALADPNVRSPRGRVVSILRKFDYVFTTESLDQQMQGLARDLTLLGPLERRRVAEKKESLDLSNDEIEQRNPIDLELFEMANKKLDQQGRHNPFGGGKAARVRAITQLQSSSMERSHERVYQELSQALCQNLRAEAAIAKLNIDSKIALRHPRKFQEVLKQNWETYAATLPAERVLISKNWLARWQANNLCSTV